MRLVTSVQMRAREQAAVDAGMSLDALMESAGLAVAQEAWLTLGVVADRRILVLVGAGNNGGDGLVAARHLAEWGANVTAYLLAARDDAKLSLAAEAGAQIVLAPGDVGFVALASLLADSELVVDALLGIGSQRPIEGALAEIVMRLDRASEGARPPHVLAVDLPTGVDADSGRADPLAVRADTTVTLGFAKVGLYLLPGAENAGRVQVVDIGLPPDGEWSENVELLETGWVRERLPVRPASGNKGTFGRVIVLAGSRRYAGAARLAATACYRAGAGLVTIACPASVQVLIAPAIAEATYLPMPEADGALAADAAQVLLRDLQESDVLLLGPGLSQAPAVGDVVARIIEALPNSQRGCVVDADALNALAKTSDWHERVSARLVLTPHPGEMSRLTGSDVAAIQNDRLGCVTSAASSWRQTVVLKGAHTIIASPDGTAAVSPYANPLLATAGTGDVLAGAIAGLLAQRLSPFDAAACGVYAHSFAGEELSREMGDAGLLAGELADALPRAFEVIRHGRKPATSAPGYSGLFATALGRQQAPEP